MPQGHQYPVGRPGERLQVVREPVDRPRVVAHDLLRRRYAGEQPRAVVEDGGRAAVPGFRGERHRPAAERRDALVSEADTEQRDTAGRDDVAADAEVARNTRCSRPRGDHDVVEPVEVLRTPPGLVVTDDRGLGSADLAEIVGQVVGEGIVVVDEESSHACPLRRVRARSGTTAACRGSPPRAGKPVVSFRGAFTRPPRRRGRSCHGAAGRRVAAGEQGDPRGESGVLDQVGPVLGDAQDGRVQDLVGRDVAGCQHLPPHEAGDHVGVERGPDPVEPDLGPEVRQ